VKRIADMCGYSSANRLTHVFGAKVGMAMRDWRAENRHSDISKITLVASVTA